MRRRLYEAVRLVDKNIKEPQDIVITVFQDALLDEPPTSLARQVKRQLTEAGVLAKKPTD
jgi:RNase P protein component